MENVLICRHWRNPSWRVVENPNFSTESSELHAAAILKEQFVDYVEYQNSGIIYRVVRANDLQNYDLGS